MPVPYIGSGPYCYANSLAMVLGDEAPPPSAIEVLTGAPFGATFLAGLPYFSPAGWNPDLGLGPATAALGWACERTAGRNGTEAVALLRAAVAAGPVLAGPVEFGLLGYLPGMGAPVGSDHFVVVLAVDEATVTVHDPHGHPYATLPVAAFVAAWRATTVPYPATPFTMRAGFHRCARWMRRPRCAIRCPQPYGGCTARPRPLRSGSSPVSSPRASTSGPTPTW